MFNTWLRACSQSCWELAIYNIVLADFVCLFVCLLAGLYVCLFCFCLALRCCLGCSLCELV